jgi:hypothetical protein
MEICLLEREGEGRVVKRGKCGNKKKTTTRRGGRLLKGVVREREALRKSRMPPLSD